MTPLSRRGLALALVGLSGCGAPPQGSELPFHASSFQLSAWRPGPATSAGPTAVPTRLPSSTPSQPVTGGSAAPSSAPSSTPEPAPSVFVGGGTTGGGGAASDINEPGGDTYGVFVTPDPSQLASGTLTFSQPQYGSITISADGYILSTVVIDPNSGAPISAAHPQLALGAEPPHGIATITGSMGPTGDGLTVLYNSATRAGAVTTTADAAGNFSFDVPVTGTETGILAAHGGSEAPPFTAGRVTITEGQTLNATALVPGEPTGAILAPAAPAGMLVAASRLIVLDGPANAPKQVDLGQFSVGRVPTYTSSNVSLAAAFDARNNDASADSSIVTSGAAGLAFLGAGDVAEDLARRLRPAAGAGEIELALAEMDAFAAGEPGRALGVAAIAQVLVGVVHPVEIDPAHRTPVALAPVGLAVPVAGIGVGALRQGERLEAAAALKFRAVVGQVSVEEPEAVAHVLGQVDHAGAGIDAGGFVTEAAHGADGVGIGDALEP